MFEIYPRSFRGWRKDYPLLNCGGNPRYMPQNDKNLCNKHPQKYLFSDFKKISRWEFLN